MQKRNGFIIPFAKQTGLTSFASMTAVKKALGTKKVGHTGTLDSFADGLLVLLSDKMTHLAGIISAGKKSYEVWAEFGIQTSSLDTEGEIIRTAELPTLSALEKAIPEFIGKIEQVPPEFSAIKINGKRASDRIRQGERVDLAPRPIEIFNIGLINIIPSLDGKVKYARLSVDCSKGTYIRSLVRDLAAFMKTCGYVKALRRTEVGPFTLEKAAGFTLLPDFSQLPKTWEIKSENGDCKKNYSEQKELSAEEIKNKILNFTPDIAEKLNLKSLFISEKYLNDFHCGKKIKIDWFTSLQKEHVLLFPSEKAAVFFNGLYTGLISMTENGFKYETVIKI
ncbi:tRNA pseudouridine(55) synthase TruB [Treponema pedis]|uniref:tRNA pseudouridine(55) synthase TruB n=1 Tax=Treponema pedis TaxID=409322 RepID=UPI00041A3638|nr:tRNA pseudouridine(55) synthase TruB [Treponema pedis]QSI05563.1 tRNA pseudouridine(55) synthase TruB [Treponema pedis]